MKKLLLLSFLTLLFAGINAQTWTFETLNGDTYSADATPLTGLTIYASSSATVSVDESDPKTFDGVDYVARLKTGGAGKVTDGVPGARVIEIAVSGPGTLTVAVMSSSSTGDDRVCGLSDGTTQLTTFAASPSATDLATYNYTGTSDKLYLYSTSGGINFYMIKYEASGSSAITDIDYDQASIVSTVYYNIAGQKTDNPSGVTIKKDFLSNGKVKVSKIIL